MFKPASDEDISDLLMWPGEFTFSVAGKDKILSIIRELQLARTVLDDMAVEGEPGHENIIMPLDFTNLDAYKSFRKGE